MSINPLSNLSAFFDINRQGRLTPIEGLRGVAVGLVFLQHYCAQFVYYSKPSGFTLTFARTFFAAGNYGVELFFVISGFLIYGILLDKQPSLIYFITRRAKRLYPAFLVALAIGALLDFARPVPHIPGSFYGGAIYVGENMLFLPGLFPIVPLFSVNWSLSYEWWFYISVTFLFATCGLVNLRPVYRVIIILALILTTMSLAAVKVPDVPLRGLCLLGGMLLAEARLARLQPISAPLGLTIAVAGLALCTLSCFPEFKATLGLLSPVFGPSVLAVGFCCLCSSVFANDRLIAAPLSMKYLRWYGNISYSYYLVHGFMVVLSLRLLFRMVVVQDADLLFWISLLPVFFGSVVSGALLFLFVEKPLSLASASPAQARTPVLVEMPAAAGPES
jgi:exopolysaccharide production protein ExoZ